MDRSNLHLIQSIQHKQPQKSAVFDAYPEHEELFISYGTAESSLDGIEG